MESKGYIKKISSLIRIKKFFILLLLFFILFTPMSFQNIKLILLIVLSIIFAIEKFKTKSLLVHPKVTIWLLIYITMNFLYLIYGTYGNFELFAKLAPTYLIWPILYTLSIVYANKNEETFDNTKFFYIMTIIISLYIIYIILNFKGYLPSTSLLKLNSNYTATIYNGYIDFFMPSITSLIFLLPYVVALLINYNKNMNRISKLKLFSALLISLIACIMVGRRAIIIIGLLAPMLVIMINRIISRKKSVKKLIIVILSFLSLLIVYFIITKYIPDIRINRYIESGFFNVGEERTYQYQALINSWLKKPFIGYGFGVNAEGVIRDYNIPGSYELVYIARLFQTGIIGLLIYICLILWILTMLLKISKINSYNRHYIIPTLTAVICVLITNATNPYVDSFDGLWIFFYPLGIINRFLLNEHQN